MASRVRHEAHTHFRDDAEIGLGEQPIVHGAEAVGEGLPGVTSWQGAHAGAEDFAGGEDDFEAGVHGPVVAVGLRLQVSECFAIGVEVRVGVRLLCSPRRGRGYCR